MKNKSFAVIGLGQFGMTLAVTLAESDCDVLAIDDKEENIEEISEKVTYAVKADVREPGILKALGVQNVDVAIIAVAENLEASISATMQAKDLGVPFVVAKSMNSLHGRILDKIGADKIIYPEQSMGLRVARNLMSGGYLDERFHINIIGIKQGENVTVDLDPSEPLPDNCSIIAIGKNKDLNASREELR